MNISDLICLLTIAEERSISKAAKKLFMAQSSLSQSLQEIESELGSRLFVRTSTGVRLTPAGEQMIAYAEHALVDYRQVRNQIQDMEELKAGKVEFGVSTFRGSYLIPKVLRLFKKKYPNIQVEITEANSMELEQHLIAGQIDLALIVLPLMKLKSDVKVWLKDEVCLAVSSDHPVLEYAKETEKNGKMNQYVDLEDAVEFEYVLSGYDTVLGNIARNEFKKREIKPKMYNANLTAFFAASMARSGLGMAFTYASCKENYEDVTYLSIGREGIYLDLALAFPPDGYRSKAARALEACFLSSEFLKE